MATMNMEEGAALVAAMTRFCEEHAEENIQPVLNEFRQQLQQMNDAMRALQSQVMDVDTAAKDCAERSKKLEAAVDTKATMAQANEMAQAHTAHEQAALGRFQKIEDSLEKATKSLEKQVEGMQQDLHGHGQELEAATKGLREHVEGSHKELHERVGTFGQELETATRGLGEHVEGSHKELQERVVHLSGKFEEHGQNLENVTGRLGELETASETGTQGVGKQVEDLSSKVSDITSKLGDIGQELETSSKGFTMQVESVQQEQRDHAIDISCKLGKVGEKCEETSQQLGKQLEGFHQELAERAGAVEMQQLQLKGAVTEMQAEAAKGEAALQEKADLAILQDLQNTVSSLGTQLANADNVLQEAMLLKASTEELQKLSETATERATAFEQALQRKAEAVRVEQINEALMGLETQLADQERSMQNKLDLADRHFNDAIKDVKAQSTSVEDLVNTKASGQDVKQLGDTVTSNQEQLLRKTLELELSWNSGHTSKLEEVSGTVGSLQSKLPTFEKELAASSSKIEQFVSSVAFVKEQLAQTEKVVQTKAAAAEVQDLEYAITGRLQQVDEVLNQGLAGVNTQLMGLGETVSKSADTIQSLQTVSDGVGKQLEGLKQELDGKALACDVQNLSGLVSQVQVDVDKAGQDKVSTAQLQQINDSLSGVQTKIADTGRELLDKAKSSDVQHLRTLIDGMKADTSCIEKAVQLKSAAQQRAAEKLEALEQLLERKKTEQQQNMADATRVTALEESLQSKVGALEESLQGKLDGTQFAALKDVVLALQSKVPIIEHGVQAGTDRMNQCESSLTSLVEQLSQTEQDVHSKADASHLTQFENVVNLMQTQVREVEQATQDKLGTNHIQTLRSAVGSLETQMGDIDHVLQQKAGVCQIHHLESMVSGVESKLAVVERTMQDKGSSGGKIPANFMEELEKKADKAYVDNEIQSKAGEVYVNADFDKKRLKAYVDTEMLKKADIELLNAELAKRPMKEEVANAVMSVVATQR